MVSEAPWVTRGYGSRPSSAGVKFYLNNYACPPPWHWPKIKVAVRKVKSFLQELVPLSHRYGLTRSLRFRPEEPVGISLIFSYLFPGWILGRGARQSSAKETKASRLSSGRGYLTPPKGDAYCFEGSRAVAPDGESSKTVQFCFEHHLCFCAAASRLVTTRFEARDAFRPLLACT